MPEVTFFDKTWTIEASAPEVFDLLADVEEWPEWTSAITSASRSGTGDLSHGDTITFTPNFHLALPLSTTVREVTKPNRISWGVRIPGFNLEHRFEISKKGQGCEVRQVEFAEGLLAPSLLPFKGLFQTLDQTWGDDLAAHFE
jgi:hypothetical protein